jgi:hypothetical protein
LTGSELQHPAPHGFVGDVESAFGQQFFDIVTVNAFATGHMLARATRRQRIAMLTASIGIDLAILGFFKY